VPVSSLQHTWQHTQQQEPGARSPLTIGTLHVCQSPVQHGHVAVKRQASLKGLGCLTGCGGSLSAHNQAAACACWSSKCSNQQAVWVRAASAHFRPVEVIALQDSLVKQRLRLRGGRVDPARCTHVQAGDVCVRLLHPPARRQLPPRSLTCV
jgi:hypothetical protein